MEPDQSDPRGNPSARGSNWREWSGREDGSEQYKFGDLSRGVLQQVQAGMRDLKHKVADKALSLKEEHESKAAEYVRELVASDESQEAQHVVSVEESKATTTAERFWTRLCKDAHTDHGSEEPVADPLSCGTLQVQVLRLGSPELLKADGKAARKPVLLLSLHGRRSGALREGGSATFEVMDVLGSDLAVYCFDRGSSTFAIGMEDQAFCGGCFVPLTLLAQPHARRFWDGMRNSLYQQVFSTELRLRLLPLVLMRGKEKLEPGDLTGAKLPKVQPGIVVLRLTLHLTKSPAKLCFRPYSSRKPIVAEQKGHVSDPFSVLNAAGKAVGRIGFALKMDLWKAAADEMREDLVVCPLLLAWWTLVVLAAPLWIWPLLLNFILVLFAWTLGGLSCREAHQVQRQLYVDEEGVVSKDLVKEAFKTQLSIMQLTETLNEAASQVEKLKFVFGLEDRCLSSVCFVVALLASLALCAPAAILYWLLHSGAWRYILWLPGSCALMPKALRSPTFQFVQKLEKLRLEFMGDDLDRIVRGFWQRMPDGTEACHLHLCRKHVLCDESADIAEPPEAR
ncbi:unnamed protein product [Symbiodinium sp. CCMP2592]|nr:unnamed protein product [Symbiodinium sp. CCMP2592]